MKNAIIKSCEKFNKKSRFYDKFNFTVNKDGSVSVCCDSLMLFKVSELKNTYRIVSKIAVSELNEFGISFLDEKDSFFRYTIEDKNCFEICLNAFLSIIMLDIDSYILANYTAEAFGCCSRYVQCSDLKNCIHPDVLHSKGCVYRKNLESGRIFYGKNKNI